MPYGHPAIHGLSVNTELISRNAVALLSAGISMTWRIQCIHHVSGQCRKYSQGQRSKVKVQRRHVTRPKRAFGRCNVEAHLFYLCNGIYQSVVITILIASGIHLLNYSERTCSTEIINRRKSFIHVRHTSTTYRKVSPTAGETGCSAIAERPRCRVRYSFRPTVQDWHSRADLS